MPTTTIIVQHRSGSGAKGQKVVLSFDHGGVTPTLRTDRDGKAVIDHAAKGNAKVIINGRTVGTVRTPTHSSYEV